MPAPEPLRGRTALVTGASRGLGAATAAELTAAGAGVFLAARDAAKLREEAQALNRRDRIAFPVVCDVTRLDDVRAAVRETLATRRTLDIVVNCAGVPGPLSPLAGVDPDRWRETVEINLIGAFHVARAALEVFHRQGHGILVNISTGAADTAAAGFSPYCAAKAGLAMLSRVLHAEEGDNGVRVFSLRPGRLDTDFHRQMMAEDSGIVATLPPAELLPPAVPARVIAYLCTDEAGDLAGRELSVHDERFADLIRD